MEITSGKYKGKTAKLNSWATDWINADIDGERPSLIVKPLQVKLNEEEIARVRAANPAHAGMFWKLWHLEDNGTFVEHDHGRPITLGVTAALGKRRSGRRNLP